MVEKYHSGGFNDPEAEGTPTFFLDGEVTSEIVVDEGIGLHVAVDKLIKEQSWFMMTPPDGEDRGWCLYIQFNRHSPDSLLVRGNHTTVPPSRERDYFRGRLTT
jgi:hypothetical protein